MCPPFSYYNSSTCRHQRVQTIPKTRHSHPLQLPLDRRTQTRKATCPALCTSPSSIRQGDRTNSNSKWIRPLKSTTTCLSYFWSVSICDETDKKWVRHMPFQSSLSIHVAPVNGALEIQGVTTFFDKLNRRNSWNYLNPISVRMSSRLPSASAAYALNLAVFDPMPSASNTPHPW